MPCLSVFQVPRTLLVLLTVLALVSFTACKSTVTSGGVPVTNEALATAARSIHIAELAASTVADGLTAGLKARLISYDVGQHFQAVVAPRIQGALATAKIAVQTAQNAPGSTPMEMVLRAVLDLQSETTALQGWYTNHALIVMKGTTP